MPELISFGAALILIGIGAWVAACDAALGVVSRADIIEIGQTSSRRQAMQRIADDLPRHVMALSFARVISETTAAVLVTLAVISLTQSWWLTLVISGVAMVLISFVLVGTSPRAVGRRNARALLRTSTPLIRASRIILGPVASLIITIGERVTPGRQRDLAFTSEEQLLSIVDEAASRDVLEDDDRELIHSIFEFNDTLVREVMVPRPDMITIERHETAEHALLRFLETGLSRMPVTGESSDEILGILYLRDTVRSRTWRPDDSETAESLARPALFVPESKKADDTLTRLQLERVHVAMVVDEYGGIAGLVTLEDLIEELVGEIQDEYDRGGGAITEQPDGSFLVSSRVQIDELGDLFGLSLDDDDVDTVGGLIAKHLGRLADVGDTVHSDGLVLEVVTLDGRGRKTGLVRARRAGEETS